MRTILKGVEPRSLTEHRQTAGANYENYQDKDTLREYLVREQRGLCCYCMAPIRPDRHAMKIEHFHSQTSHREEQLRYSNLLGACMGGEGASFAYQHCDTRKGDRELSRNPAGRMHQIEELIRFHADGHITAGWVDFDIELNEILNLNLPFLISNRRQALDGFLDGVARRGQFSRAMLERWLQQWSGESDNGPLLPYCQVVVYWLRKRLARSYPRYTL
jgi:uncharacterized protein (TIGR02646 family)